MISHAHSSPRRFALVALLLAVSVVYLMGAVADGWPSGKALLDQGGQPLGRDFIAFWSAAALALDGAPEAAYSVPALQAAQAQAIGMPVDPTAWHYPPTFLVLVLPLGVLPYPAAVVAWLVLSLAAFLAVARRLYAPRLAWALALFPATTLCLISGQNGLLTAALLGAGMMTLERRPVAAGLCFGLLTYKPHLAMLLVPVLAIGGHWRCLAAFALMSAALVLASLAALGTAPWWAFYDNLGFVTRLLDRGDLPWFRMPTVFAAARLLGAEIEAARLLQTAASLVAAAASCAVWYRSTSLALRGAALAVAIPLATPYAFDYDLVVLALAIGWLVSAGSDEDDRPGEVIVLTLAWLSPGLFWLITLAGGPPLMPLMLMALLAVIWMRIARAPAALRVGSIGVNKGGL